MSSTSSHGDFPNRRSSRPEVFYKQGVLNVFEKFLGKHLCRSLFIKVASLTQVVLQHFEQHFFCKTNTKDCF